jgi:hypothetical protein
MIIEQTKCDRLQAIIDAQEIKKKDLEHELYVVLMEKELQLNDFRLAYFRCDDDDQDDELREIAESCFYSIYDKINEIVDMLMGLGNPYETYESLLKKVDGHKDFLEDNKNRRVKKKPGISMDTFIDMKESVIDAHFRSFGDPKCLDDELRVLCVHRIPILTMLAVQYRVAFNLEDEEPVFW